MIYDPATKTYHCDPCLFVELEVRTYHCGDVPKGGYGKPFRGCHETFAKFENLEEHLHSGTGGCRFPGNIKDFYEVENIWHKKEPKKEDQDTEAYLNSKPTRDVGSRSTSNVSEGVRPRKDRQPGQY